MRNGYEMVYLPEHHRADSTGCVYEHVIVAEQKLGRLLKNEECIHHLNEIRNDNRPENLIVFKTIADHTAFHMGCDIILEEDVYIALPHKNSICPLCGGHKGHKAKICLNCWNTLSRKVERPSKEELSQLIINMPFTKVGELFGVDGNTIRKWCKSYGLSYKYRDLHPKQEKTIKRIIYDNTYRIQMTDDNSCVEFNNFDSAIDYLFENNIANSTSLRTTIKDNIVRAFKKEKKYYGYNWLVFK